MREDRFRRNVQFAPFCPLCHTRYRPFEAAVLDAHDDAHLVYVQCRACHCAILALVYLDGNGASSIGLVTDLTKEEVMQYRGAEAVGADDVIEAHQLFVGTQNQSAQ